MLCKRTIIIVVALLLIWHFAKLYFSFVDKSHINTTEIAQKSNEARENDSVNSVENRESIKIPGFDHLLLKTGTQDQKITLNNPAENPCYFQIQMMLPDGRTIYNSDMMAPGESISKIRLNTVLPAGIYENTIIQYTCYSLDSLRIVNGADLKFTLEVR